MVGNLTAGGNGKTPVVVWWWNSCNSAVFAWGL
ncbi:tetraacyldisaccharide 4'-kinase [Escherichia coli]